jgi:hypothetical protein
VHLRFTNEHFFQNAEAQNCWYRERVHQGPIQNIRYLGLRSLSYYTTGAENGQPKKLLRRDRFPELQGGIRFARHFSDQRLISDAGPHRNSAAADQRIGA